MPSLDTCREITGGLSRTKIKVLLWPLSTMQLSCQIALIHGLSVPGMTPTRLFSVQMSPPRNQEKLVL